LIGPIPGGRRIYYQKHLAHHWLPHLRGDWVLALSNAFLIRHPAEMLSSLAAKMGQPVLRDTGLPQQVELFRATRARAGCAPPVVDARDVLADPPGMLRRLCSALGLEFTPAMLAWEPGLRPTDGIWAEHWYADVARSTGFAPYAPRAGALGPELEAVHAECVGFYRELHEHRLTS
jgi:hypothetical protein